MALFPMATTLMNAIREEATIATTSAAAGASHSVAGTSASVAVAGRTALAHTVERGVGMQVREQVATMTTVSRTLDAVPLSQATNPVLRSESSVLPGAIANDLSTSVRAQVENAMQQGVEEVVDHELNGRGGVTSSVMAGLSAKQ
ncbi:hypothetical protein CALCODRAFT_484898 [Calocera cornea HHB12733]|uniref:Uncharacterized protein n=1 Tax=Calocera cornea HHB12733 TaxID=1353952 RepID=A0A165ENR6_9BASI|nr:hypothetical protein CALCODRAFT_484898 [Calocera cornea HHB12733]